MTYRITPAYTDLMPYEYIRWHIRNDNGYSVGYASRFITDGRSKWVAWDNKGLRQEVQTRKRAIDTIVEHYRL